MHLNMLSEVTGFVLVVNDNDIVTVSLNIYVYTLYIYLLVVLAWIIYLVYGVYYYPSLNIYICVYIFREG